MFIIFTGHGKGKTTAAIGQALRAVGNGSKVLMVQFIKGPWKSGEDVSVKKLSPDFKIVKKGKGFVGIGNDKVPFVEHVAAAHDALAYAQQEVETKKWDIIILDELWNAYTLKLITAEEILDFIHKATLCVDHIICTGRDCPSQFIDMADLVTEMKETKHPFLQGISATKSVEF